MLLFGFLHRPPPCVTTRNTKYPTHRTFHPFSPFLHFQNERATRVPSFVSLFTHSTQLQHTAFPSRVPSPVPSLLFLPFLPREAAIPSLPAHYKVIFFLLTTSISFLPSSSHISASFAWPHTSHFFSIFITHNSSLSNTAISFHFEEFSKVSRPTRSLNYPPLPLPLSLSSSLPLPLHLHHHVDSFPDQPASWSIAKYSSTLIHFDEVKLIFPTHSVARLICHCFRDALVAFA